MSAAVRGLFVSDVDGTLVTPDKQLTPATLQAAQAMRAVGAPFTLVSARPPRGIAPLARALGLTLPFAAFNGGNLVAPDLTLIEAHHIPAEAAREALAVIDRQGVGAFVVADDSWLVRDPHGPLTDRERRTVGFEPTASADFDAVIARIDKIVAVCEEPARLDPVEAELRERLSGAANVGRSQAYYVDVTHLLANKGDAVRRLAAEVGADLSFTIVLGDMDNDLAMFRVAGFAIAMGQASASVKAEAAVVTGANTEDGFAHAVRTWVLPRLAAAPAA